MGNAGRQESPVNITQAENPEKAIEEIREGSGEVEDFLPKRKLW